MLGVAQWPSQCRSRRPRGPLRRPVHSVAAPKARMVQKNCRRYFAGGRDTGVERTKHRSGCCQADRAAGRELRSAAHKRPPSGFQPGELDEQVRGRIAVIVGLYEGVPSRLIPGDAVGGDARIGPRGGIGDERERLIVGEITSASIAEKSIRSRPIPGDFKSVPPTVFRRRSAAINARASIIFTSRSG